MSLANYDVVLRFLRQRGVDHILLSGGEPTLHPDFATMVAKANAAAFRAALATHGARLTRELIPLLRETKVLVQVSIDTVDDLTYKRMRGHNALCHALKVVEELVSAQISVTAGIVVTKLNCQTLRTTIKTLCSLGVASFHISEVKPLGCGSKEFSALRVGNLYQVLVELYELQKELYPEATIDWIEDMLRGITLPQRTAYCNAMAGNLLQIDCRGNIFRCINLGASTYMGNVFATNSRAGEPAALHIRGSLPQLPVECAECSYVAMCRGGCRAYTYALTGDLLSRHPRCEEMKPFFDLILRDQKSGRLDDILFALKLSDEARGYDNFFAKWV